VATVIAVSAAPGPTCCFACAAVVQHRATRDAGGAALTPALLLRPARSPLWLAASAPSALSFAIQELALAFGSLVTVRPEHGRDRKRLAPRDHSQA
jgi:hypothetical protein